MSQRYEPMRGGDFALAALRFVLLAVSAGLVGVLAHVAWKVISG
ncbi:hypothetical protein [Roseococcus sp. YIM B11640]